MYDRACMQGLQACTDVEAYFGKPFVGRHVYFVVKVIQAAHFAVLGQEAHSAVHRHNPKEEDDISVRVE
eukprot:CAMPEP_0167830432 /NCGR_PEP_ID=MMETSP0112_2-20121227/12937_1 /TAXON_ID=91324 /ORGANISM="Lotharella globosa, Strain CCCM811" /LENGTH=68 /DNA_ID=CAMNT_0007734687 /DNA_START=540 /DNA_END=746 /DNA_ORIENTATION=+